LGASPATPAPNASVAPQVSRQANVDAGRGIAALLVVLYHVDKYYFASAKYWTDGVFGGVFKFGHAGVEFFFVLSGFIMLMIHRRDIGQADRVRAFATKRFDRIYPFLWAVLLVTLAMFYVKGSGGEDFRNPLVVLQSALLVGKNPFDAIVFVSWTLWHEVLFYGFCALVIGLPRVGIPAFVAWTAACLILPMTAFEPPWPAYVTSHVNALFAIGVGCSAALSRWTIPAPRLLLASGALLFVVNGLVTSRMGVSHTQSAALTFGMASAMMLMGAVEAERSGLLKAPRWLVTMGEASFAIYLTHMLFLPVAAMTLARLGMTSILTPPVAFIMLSAVGVGGGLAAHFLIERPITRAIKTLRGQRVRLA
jgi:peptidoglycan/LPS O-acetylase OafA/YrhL